MRTRDLKPGFFRDEGLTELPFVTRILYAGLWCYVDRRGRCKDNPKLIKADVFPYENVPVEKHLKQLADAGFIERYEADGLRLIWIPKFLDHQHPHPNETASVLPKSPNDNRPESDAEEHQGMSQGNTNGTSRGAPRYSPNPANHQPPTTNTLATRDLATNHSPPTFGPPDPAEVLAGRKPVFKFFEQLFGPKLGPNTAQRLIEYEQSLDPECIEHCFQEAADANARTPALLYRILDRHAAEGCYAGRSTATSNANATTDGLPATPGLTPSERAEALRSGALKPVVVDLD